MTDPLQPSLPWRQMQGLACGLRQPALLGRLTVDALPASRLAEVEHGLGALIDEPLPDLSAAAAAGARLASAFAFCVGAIQRQSRIPVSERFHVRPLGGARTGRLACLVALPSPDVRASRIAFDWSIGMLNRLASGSGGPADAAAAREEIHLRLRPFADQSANRFGIAQAADRLDIPVSPLTHDVLVLGTGIHARWMQSTITDATPAIGASIAQHKKWTADVLRAAGLPGAEHFAVDSPDAAVAAARRLGFPVVVKPADRDRGEGVAADIRDEAGVASAYEAARKFSAQVLVERWVPGFTHRLTVFNGRVIRVTRRIAGGVVGDGRSDLAALVLQAQQTPHHQRMIRRLGYAPLVLDDEAVGLLRQQGLEPSHVPAEGEYVRLRRRDNINAGGTNEEVDLGAVHADNLRLAVDAARMLRLDFAGIDLIIGDVACSWLDSQALICEINAMPQMRAAADPSIYERVLAEFMGGRHRIPARLLVCPADEAARAAVLGRSLATGRYNGVSDRGGLWIDGVRATAAFGDGLRAGRALLMRSDVRGAVCLMTPQDIVSRGLPESRWEHVALAAPEAFTDQEKVLLREVRALLAASSGSAGISGAAIANTARIR